MRIDEPGFPRGKHRRAVRTRRIRGYAKIAAAARKDAEERSFGSQGAASAVRRIDPCTGEVVAVILAHD